jgi:uncharacterized protein (TIGR03032 family)
LYVQSVYGAAQGAESRWSPAAPETAPTAVEYHYTQSDCFAAVLHQLGASLLVTTYQANMLLVVREAGGGLSTLVRTFDRPMGLAADARRLALGTRNQIWILHNASDIAPRVEPAGQHDARYLRRSYHVTGDPFDPEGAVSVKLTDAEWRFVNPAPTPRDSSHLGVT